MHSWFCFLLFCSKSSIVLICKKKKLYYSQIGADGARSRIRQAMNVDYTSFSYNQSGVVATLVVEVGISSEVYCLIWFISKICGLKEVGKVKMYLRVEGRLGKSKCIVVFAAVPKFRRLVKTTLPGSVSAVLVQLLTYH